jgi:hypothetical protein
MWSSKYNRIFWKLFKVKINKRFITFFCISNIFRRDKLWIAMELCAGGSMQDIYHGLLDKNFFFWK